MAKLLRKSLTQIQHWQANNSFWYLLGGIMLSVLLIAFIKNETLILVALVAITGIIGLWYYPEAGLAFTVNGVVTFAVVRDIIGLAAGQWVTLMVLAVFGLSLFIILIQDAQIINWRMIGKLMSLPLVFGVFLAISWLGSENPAYGLVKLIRYGTIHLTVTLAAAFALTSRQRLRKVLRWLVILGLVLLIGSFFNLQMLTAHLGRLSIAEDINPITFARSLGFGAIAALLFWGRSRNTNISLILLLMVTTISIILTGSRGPFLGFFFALVFFFLAWNRKPSRLIWAFLGLLALIALVWIVMPPDFWGLRIVSLSASASIMQRFTIWSTAIELIAQSPFFGIGLGGYDAHIGFGVRWPHNIILEIWAEVGLPALVLFVWFVFRAAVIGWRRRLNADHELRHLISIFLALLVLTFVVAQFSGDITFNYLIWFAATVLQGVQYLEGKQDD